MSIQGASVHPKLSDAAMAELKLLSEVRNTTMQSIVEDILHRALLGESYALKIAVDRAIRSGLLGSNR